MLELSVTRLEKDFEGLLHADGRDRAFYDVCWGEDAELCVYLDVYKRAGRLFVDSFMEAYWACNAWWWCVWGVPVNLTLGSPGLISFEVPRFLIPEVPGLSLPPMAAGSAYFDSTAPTNCLPYCARSGRTDSTSSATFSLTRAARPPTVLDGPAVYLDHTDDVTRSGGGNVATSTQRPDLDILRSSIIETEVNLTIAIQLARLEATPRAHFLEFELGLPSGSLVEAGYDVRQDGGDREPWAGLEDCCDWHDIEVEMTIAAGSPGWANFTFDRAAIDAFGRGDHTNLFEVETGSRTSQPATFPLYGPASYVREWDWHLYVPAYVFQHGVPFNETDEG